MIGSLFRRSARVAAPQHGARAPDGVRLYAIGDVHGRADLLDALLAMIDADDAARPAAATRLLFLGDLIDRGPDSRGVVDRVMARAESHPGTRHLIGNHEEVFLRALDGDVQAMRLFARIGGRETLASYGIIAAEFDAGSFRDLAALARARVPDAHRRFLARGEDLIVEGGYAFVHAGIRPGTPLAEQKPADLRWIRDDFLDSDSRFGHCIVHGHSIAPGVDVQRHRIGIDTGAYASGVLTAIGIEGESRWTLQTGPGGGRPIPV